MNKNKFNAVLALHFAGGGILAALAPKFLLLQKLPIMSLLVAAAIIGGGFYLAAVKDNIAGKAVAFAALSYAVGMLEGVVTSDAEAVSKANTVIAATVAIAFIATLVESGWTSRKYMPRVMLAAVVVSELMSTFAFGQTFSVKAVVIEIITAAAIARRFTLANARKNWNVEFASRQAFMLYGEKANSFMEAIGSDYLY